MKDANTRIHDQLSYLDFEDECKLTKDRAYRPHIMRRRISPEQGYQNICDDDGEMDCSTSGTVLEA